MDNISKLLNGFAEFQAKYPALTNLADPQKPSILVISCCDSRVDPAILLNAAPGEIFVIRNIANLVPHYSHGTEAPGIRAAIEFAVRTLEVEEIIVLGHSDCGGIAALLNRETRTAHYEFIDAWVSIAERARQHVLESAPDRSPREQAKICAQAAIVVSLGNLLTFPWIETRVNAKSLAIHGWYFDLETTTLQQYDKPTGYFR